MMKTRRLLTCLASVVLIVTFATASFAQGRASLRGQISDEFGASIVGATVTLTDASGAPKTATTNADGAYSFTGLAPGKYKVHANAAGFATSEDAEVDLTAARRDPLNISLKIAAIESQVKINSETPLSTESSNNANQTVISGRDLDALPDDPTELAAALQALAGPSIGPNGGQIFIDGFSGGNMPPKESIREIRINQNPFAAENDQPSGSINIFTRPGTDKFRGSASLNFNDESLNSRNPFQINSSKRSPYQIRQYGGSFSGPLKKGKASFFLEFNRNETDDNELVRAEILDSSFNPVQVGQVVLSPRRFTNFSPRVDYAINSRNTLVARYSYNHNLLKNLGVNGASLPERGFDQSSTSQVFQVTETAVLNATTINETRFQYSHNRSESLGNTAIPTLNVSGAFIGGGPSVGQSSSTSKRWELQNFTQIQKGMHTIKFGGRVREVSIEDINRGNYNGQWIFTGGITGQTSLQRYQRTLQLMQQNMTPAQIRAAGGGAAQFSINAGDPLASVSQFDIEPYVQDDWRYRPNLTLSFGLRYEIQNNAQSTLGFAPRFAVAWSPGAADSTHPPKTVIRFGTGIFYNRFNENSTLQANRFNGVKVQQFIFAESANPLVATDPATLTVLNSFRCQDGSFTPDCVTIVPSIVGASPLQQSITRIAPDLRVPTVYVAGGQVERQLPHNFTVSVGAYAIRILHVIRTRDINAPLPGTITNANPGGIRPNPTIGEVNQIESTARFHQKQMFVGFNSRLNPQFSLSGNYSLSKTTNDSDGQGSASLPRNSYDVSDEWGRGGFDVRHRFSLFGTYNNPKLWKLTFSPFIVASSAPPFNIITGIDSNLDRSFTDRPSFAGANANCASPFIKCTRFGNFNLLPVAGEAIVPRNFGHATGSFTANLRITRSFGFGDVHRAAASGQGNTKTAAAAGDKRSGGPSSPGSRGPMIAGGGGGGGEGRGPGGGGGQMMGMGGGGGAASAEKKYNLTVSLFIQNILNNVNYGPPDGNLSSPLFGQPRSLGGSFGFGPGGSPNAGNRRVSLNLRLNF
jgi:uncharacterized lipoprotein NlpE involved in copper resistance